MIDQHSSTTAVRPVILTILDGWGVAPDSPSNAITQAKTPNFNLLCQKFFCTTLQASGEAVGLPYGEMGNSEVGHLNLGAGKIVYQDLPRINRSITTGEFFKNPILIKACQHSLKNNSSLHLMGLLSKGGVHGSVDHLYALLELAKNQGVKNVLIHVFLDGRDMAYNSGLSLVKELEVKIKEIGVGRIATIVGRFWAMDRDNRWQRTECAYQAMVFGQAEHSTTDPVKFIEDVYKKEIFDEEFPPSVILNKNNQPNLIGPQDSIVFFNFRSDRARQLTKAFVLPGFEKFNRGQYFQDIYFVTMVQYEKQLPVDVAFPPELVTNPLAKVIADSGRKQLHVAETEKYAHVTYFFNGGNEQEFVGEQRIMIPSPKVDSYAQRPQMSAIEIKNAVLKAITAATFDFIVINFANPDMVGHTGDKQATIKAIETVDKCLGEIAESLVDVGGAMIITADHGNAEELVNLQTGEIDKEHSTAPVPFILIGRDFVSNEEQAKGTVDLSLLTPAGVLSDIAPTILKIMGLPRPPEMTGTPLV